MSTNLLFGLFLTVLSFTGVDRSFVRESYTECRDSLVVMLPRAQTGKEKSEVLWRLSRVSLMLGEKAPSREEKRAVFGEGVRYASEGIQSDPANVQCYMWHCANTGRECQTRGVKEQAAAVPAMLKDLETILDRYGRTDCSEAWQALSEIYHAHPFKPEDKAVNYARKAAETIPPSELRLSTYAYLARLLHERNWSASKRASAIASDAARFKAAGLKNSERFGYFDGASGPEGKAPWSDKPLSAQSDREEAIALLQYAIRRYDAAPRHTRMDARDSKTLKSLAEQWKTN